MGFHPLFHYHSSTIWKPKNYLPRIWIYDTNFSQHWWQISAMCKITHCLIRDYTKNHAFITNLNILSPFFFALIFDPGLPNPRHLPKVGRFEQSLVSNSFPNPGSGFGFSLFWVPLRHSSLQLVYSFSECPPAIIQFNCSAGGGRSSLLFVWIWQIKVKKIRNRLKKWHPHSYCWHI